MEVVYRLHFECECGDVGVVMRNACEVHRCFASPLAPQDLVLMGELPRALQTQWINKSPRFGTSLRSKDFFLNQISMGPKSGVILVVQRRGSAAPTYPWIKSPTAFGVYVAFANVTTTNAAWGQGSQCSGCLSGPSVQPHPRYDRIDVHS